MKQIRLGLIIAGLFTLMILSSIGVPAPKPDYWTIPSGEIQTSDGTTITTGYDEYGYNYQAHMFNGIYSDYDRVHGGPYSDVQLIMVWNDAWLSNKDFDKDHSLDRHHGYTSYIGSGAWETNYMEGTYEMDGETCHWNYFTKICAVPEDAYLYNGIWYYADGSEMGPSIWGQFATVLSVYNDPCGGFTGIEYLGSHPGFGYN